MNSEIRGAENRLNLWGKVSATQDIPTRTTGSGWSKKCIKQLPTWFLLRRRDCDDTPPLKTTTTQYMTSWSRRCGWAMLNHPSALYIDNLTMRICNGCRDGKLMRLDFAQFDSSWGLLDVEHAFGCVSHHTLNACSSIEELNGRASFKCHCIMQRTQPPASSHMHPPFPKRKSRS